MKKALIHSTKTRVISLILTLLIIFQILPVTVFAEALSTGMEESSNVTATQALENDEQTVHNAGLPVFEVEELREETVKHFRLEDGSYLAASYVEPVHYLDDDGNWQDIDNRLLSSGSEFSTSDAKIKFAKKITGNETLFTLHDGNEKITMGLVGAIKKTEGVVTSDHSTDDNEETELGKLMNLENLTSRILYENILPGIDVEYIVHSLNVKENIIVKEKSDTYSYSFALKVNNLSASLNENGEIIFTNKNGEAKYRIPAPLVMDDVGQIAPNDAAYYTLTGESGKYTLTVTVDPEWMNSEDILFPVTVDPTIEDAGVTAVVEDVTVGQSENDPYIVIASISSPTYFKINELPELDNSSLITNAKINFTYLRSSGKVFPSVVIYDIITVCDNGIGEATVGNSIIDYELGTNPKFTYTFDITSLVTSWYQSPYENHEFAISRYVADGEDRIVTGGGKIGVMHLYSSESLGEYSTSPYFELSYVPMHGLEDYWSYTSQSAGVAGIGHINLASGNLVFDINTLTSTDYLMPVTPSLVYNSDLLGKAYTSQNTYTPYSTSYTPLGFKFNLCETVVSKNLNTSGGSTEQYYIYTDSDGTCHYFSSVSMTDEDGLGLEMEYTDTTVTITDKDNTVKTFSPLGTAGWYLSQVIDKVGNSVIITVDSSYRPTKVSLSPNGSSTTIDMLSFSYNSYGKISRIQSLTSGYYVDLLYSDVYNGEPSVDASTYLRRVTYNYGTESISATYEYDAYGALIKACDDLAGSSITYTYNNGRKVTVAQEIGKGNIVGQELNFYYGNQYTRIRASGTNDIYGDDDDIYTYYIYDNAGRIISYYSTDVSGTKINGATTGKYETLEKAKNKIKEKTTIGGSMTNYLLNSDFDDWPSSSSAPTHWSVTDNIVRSFENNQYNYYKAYVSPKQNVTDEIYQYVFLPSGEYTLSLNYNISRFNGARAYIKVKSLTTGLDIATKELGKDQTYETDVMTDSVTFSVEEKTGGGDNLKVYVEINGGTATNSPGIYIDNLVLTDGESVMPYNFVEAGSFGDTLINSASTVTTGAESLWSMDQATIITADAPFNDVLKIVGQSGVVKESKQRIYVVQPDVLSKYDYTPSEFISNAIAEFAVSAFGYTSEELSASTDFRIRADVYYYQGTGKDDVLVSHYIDFQNIVGQWQFAAGTFSGTVEAAEGDTADYTCIRYIDIVCEYSGQPGGYALFDKISVTDCWEYSAYKYYYYESGALAKKESFFYTEYYFYDDNLNLTRKARNNGGELYEYEYNNNNQVVKEIYCSFINDWGSKHYPISAENPDDLITITPIRMTVYEYNSYGLPVKIETSTATVDGTGNATYGAPIIRHTYEYSATPAIFGALTEESDGVNPETRYFYNEDNGRLVATLQDGDGTAYSYDAIGRLTGAKPATATGQTYTATENAENVNYTYNSYGELASITTDSTVYSFTYDGFGNSDSIKVGNSAIASYEYYQNNGKLKKVNYASGFSEEYIYNSLEMLSEIWYNYSNGTSECAVRYTYTTDGSLSRVDDLLTGRSTVYVYDTAKRLVELAEYDTEDMNYDYDSIFIYSQDNRLSMQTDTLDYLAGTDVNRAFIDNSYSYTDDGKVSSSYVSFDGRTNITYSYDSLGRLYKKEYSYPTPSGFTGSEEYIYDIDADGLTAGLVGNYISKMGSTSTVYTYIYDGKGNITYVVCGSDTIKYTYDDIGQLIRENNSLLGKTYVYEYDDAGNILFKNTYAYTNEFTITSSPTATYTYTYGNSEWGDQLTGYNGSAITYDAVGNPLSYYGGFSFGWRGRDLISATKGGLAYTFEYNADGLRTSKTVGGTVHKYYYSGSLLLAEEWGNNLMVFLYDANGTPIGMKYRTTSMDAGVWNTYWYERNLQGDVVAIYNESGAKVASYVYDAWGNFTTTYHSGGASLTPVIKNPLLYRGYYYDRDLGMYYLQTRYYDSNIGRFLNADSVISGVNGSLNGYNLYAYCFNNPVSLTDGTGNWPQWAIDVGNWLNNNVFQPIATFINDIVEDARNFDINNTSEEVALNSNYFSSYNGTLVIRIDGDRSGSFGAIFLTREANSRTSPSDVVRHEYGHTKQLDELGLINYALCIMIPSWQEWGSGNYYEKPWEVTADIYGGVQSRKHSQSVIDAGFKYLEQSKFLGPLIWLFIK